MTNGVDRLDRIEALVAANATAIAEMRQSQQQVSETQRLSNEALAGSIAELRESLRESITDVVGMIGTLAEQQSQTDQGLNRLRQQQQETDQRFNNLLADSREDRQRNEREHQAFRESFQSLLAEIRAIWQRLAG
jgi:soluble cytochrome b562